MLEKKHSEDGHGDEKAVGQGGGVVSAQCEAVVVRRQDAAHA